MIDLYSAQADQVLRFLYGGAITILITGRTLELAITKLDGDVHWYRPGPVMRFTNRDSTIFVLTLVVSLIAWLPAVWISSPAYVLDMLSMARNDLGFLGWALSVSVFYNFFAPFAVALMLYIGRTRRVRKWGPRQTIGPDWV